MLLFSSVLKLYWFIFGSYMYIMKYFSVNVNTYSISPNYFCEFSLRVANLISARKPRFYKLNI